MSIRVIQLSIESRQKNSVETVVAKLKTNKRTKYKKIKIKKSQLMTTQ